MCHSTTMLLSDNRFGNTVSLFHIEMRTRKRTSEWHINLLFRTEDASKGPIDLLLFSYLIDCSHQMALKRLGHKI